MKTRYFECECDSSEHVVRMGFNDDEKECYLEVQLFGPSFFKRLWGAIKYVFGYECKYGHWDCTILGKEQIENMVIELSSFYNRTYNLNQGGGKKIKKAIKDISQGKTNSAYTPPKKKKAQ